MRNGMRRGGEFLSNPRAGRKQRQRRNFHVPNSLDMLCVRVYMYIRGLFPSPCFYFSKNMNNDPRKKWKYRGGISENGRGGIVEMRCFREFSSGLCTVLDRAGSSNAY